jgi:hypothetical protein
VLSSRVTPWTRLCAPCGGSGGVSISSASASNRIESRSLLSCVTVLLARGVASIVKRPPGATAS